MAATATNPFTIAAIRLFQYALPFKTPLTVGPHSLTHRHGLIIEVTDTRGNRGYGETAPLPGYSRETLDKARQQLMQLARQLPGKKMSVGLFPSQCRAFYPSVVFGLETAFFNLEKLACPLKQVKVNGLLYPDPQHLETQVAELVAMGFETIKIKVARLSLDIEIPLIRKVSALLPPNVKLRLDANGLWDYSRAVTFGLGIQGVTLEYIEEPCQDSTQFQDFHCATGLPVAVDESLGVMSQSNFPQGVVALILKPSFMGGIRRTLQWIQIARQNCLKPVISSCFEAGPGFAQLVHLAATIDFDDSVSGLDTMKYFGQDLFVHSPVMTRGVIPFSPHHHFGDAETWRTDLFQPIPVG